jgi:K+-transporting ATPase KdpF subunit
MFRYSIRAFDETLVFSFQGDVRMTIESLAALVVAACVLVYLVFSLIRPERF